MCIFFFIILLLSCYFYAQIQSIFILVLVLSFVVVVKGGLSVAVVVTFSNDKIIYIATTCLLSFAVSSEIPIVLLISLDWIAIFSIYVVICFICSAFYLTLCVV
jgi:hypothetical protein